MQLIINLSLDAATNLYTAVLWQVLGHVPGHDNVRRFVLLLFVSQGSLLLLLPALWVIKVGGNGLEYLNLKSPRISQSQAIKN